ncbi:citrate synthase [Modestobacter sp. NPDC049651]|uniref:citrate synthase n=1 Tax=unclassified Modestobacter TaxID=2643866 RepID=UPI0033D3BA8F
MTATPRRLTTLQVAERLGVDRTTVYAYVSRGLLHSVREGRTSTFDPDEVDRLRTQGLLARRPTSSTAVVRTAITGIGQDWLAYRGVDVTGLLDPPHVEATATWLWESVWDPTERLTGDPGALQAARRAVAALPRTSGVHARAVTAVLAAGAALEGGDGDRHERALAMGPTLVRAVALAAAAPDAEVDGDAAQPVALLLGRTLCGADPGPDVTAALAAALVLLADHDLAASTLAVRVAASTGAGPELAVAAGLGALAGPLHGSSGRAALALLDAPDPAQALAAAAARGHVPGFGHLLYRRDPRAVLLLRQVEATGGSPPTLAATRRLTATADRLGLPGANVDLALAALTRAFALPDRTPAAVHAVARTAGWIAHYLEEVDERGLRFRPRSVYEGPPRGRLLPGRTPR